MLTDSDDTEMFDNAEEDKDLASQVSRDSSASSTGEADSATEEVPSPSHPKKLTEAEVKLTDDEKNQIKEAAHSEKTKSPEATKDSEPKDASEK